MNKINIAVWGLGNHAINRILPSISNINEIKLIGVCSRNNNVVNNYAKLYGCYGWNNPTEMLACNKVDVVYISTPIGIHFSNAKQAITAGKNVWCEKPLTCNYKDSVELISLAVERGCIITESFMFLYHPQFKRLKRFVEDSKQIQSIICRFGIPALSKPGFRNNPELCGGALWDVGSYTTSALLSVFHNQTAKVVFAEVIKKEGFQVDTEGRAILKFSKGATAFLEWGTGIAYKNEIDIWGMDSSLFTDRIFSKVNDYKPQFKIYDLNGNESIEEGEKSEQFVDMFQHFIELMNNKEKSDKEKKSILKRAKLMDDIVNF